VRQDSILHLIPRGDSECSTALLIERTSARLRHRLADGRPEDGEDRGGDFARVLSNRFAKRGLDR
jgi:hypothetical protein